MAAIRERRHYRDWTDKQWLIWSTRTIATFVAATVPVESAGAKNPLLEHAQSIGDGMLPGTQAQGTDAAPSTSEPQAGSFEQFMTMFNRR